MWRCHTEVGVSNGALIVGMAQRNERKFMILRLNTIFQLSPTWCKKVAHFLQGFPKTLRHEKAR
jgi:hypothetical protein